MRTLALSLVLASVVACSHDEKSAPNTPDVAAEPTTKPATPAASAAPSGEAEPGGHSACDAVRCRGGMVCKMVSGAPTCVAKE